MNLNTQILTIDPTAFTLSFVSTTFVRPKQVCNWNVKHDEYVENSNLLHDEDDDKLQKKIFNLYKVKFMRHFEKETDQRLWLLVKQMPMHILCQDL